VDTVSDTMTIKYTFNESRRVFIKVKTPNEQELQGLNTSNLAFNKSALSAESLLLYMARILSLKWHEFLS